MYRLNERSADVFLNKAVTRDADIVFQRTIVIEFDRRMLKYWLPADRVITFHADSLMSKSGFIVKQRWWRSRYRHVLERVNDRFLLHRLICEFVYIL